MNICTRGNCICDAAEWAGDTDCFGDVVGGESEPYVAKEQRYYFDKRHGVIFSVEPQDMVPGIKYFMDPELKVRA